jgi:hypothetical protein
MNRSKIDSSGVYKRFPGLAFIAKLNDEHDIWKSIHERIKSRRVLAKYYTLLPPDSYHVVIKDCVECESFDWMCENFSRLVEMRDVCNDHIYAPTAAIIDVFFTETIGFELKFQDSIPIQYLQSLLREFGVTSAYYQDSQIYRMHIAYQYRKIELDDIPQLEVDMHEIVAMLKLLFVPFDYKLKFNTTKLCYHFDLRRYIQL